jgi:hypothetical protein
MLPLPVLLIGHLDGDPVENFGLVTELIFNVHIFTHCGKNAVPVAFLMLV